MNNNENPFDRYMEHPQTFTLGADFEDRVFTRIKKRKTRRKVTASITAVFALCAILFIGSGIIFKNSPEPETRLAQSVSNQPDNRYEALSSEKEEVPVMGEVIFSSFDSSSNYGIQQVSYNEGYSGI